MTSLVVLAFMACSPEVIVVDGNVIDVTDFKMADQSLDSHPEHRPEVLDCSPGAFTEELGQLEIDTGECDYALIQFSTRFLLPAGTEIEGMVMHSGLFHPDHAQAHYALSIDGILFEESHPAIPSDTDFFFFQGQVESEVPEGSVVMLHLHNHGVNTWRFGHLRLARE